MERDPDTSDIPERTRRGRPVMRDAKGRLPTAIDSPIRDAILEELGRTGTSRYELWRAAQQHCARISKSAVYEYLRGERDVGTTYAEAMLKASGLKIVRGAPDRFP
jgi:hypothetical protein